MKTLALALAIVSGFAHSQTPSIQWDVKIPMRDGVKLGAVVYRIKEQREPLPAILCLTPYTSSNPEARGRYFQECSFEFQARNLRLGV